MSYLCPKDHCQWFLEERLRLSLLPAEGLLSFGCRCHPELQGTPASVSYTHLDVYKRQVYVSEEELKANIHMDITIED